MAHQHTWAIFWCGRRCTKGESKRQLPELFLRELTVVGKRQPGKMDRWNECGEADRRFLAVLEMEMDEQVTRGTQDPRDLLCKL